jgi:hypothetical protein
VGSKSTITARGTCFPDPVSLKNVEKAPSRGPAEFANVPSGRTY